MKLKNHIDRFVVVAKGENWKRPTDERVFFLFEAICDALDRPDVLWLPGMAEVIADDDKPVTHLLLDTMRRDCEGAVFWHKLACGDCDCEISLEDAGIDEKALASYIATV
jgi:hypothetical protein